VAHVPVVRKERRQLGATDPERAKPAGPRARLRRVDQSVDELEHRGIARRVRHRFRRVVRGVHGVAARERPGRDLELATHARTPAVRMRRMSHPRRA
jgi:hypothetical protein